MIKFFQKDISLDNVFLKYSVSFLISIVILTINVALRLSLRRLTLEEKRTTYTFHEFHIVWKISTAYFANIGLIIWITSIIVYKGYERIIWRSSGITANLMVVMALTTVSDAIFQFLNPWYVLKIIKRKLNESKIGK